MKLQTRFFVMLAFVLAFSSFGLLPAHGANGLQAPDPASPPIAGIGVILRAKGTNIVVQDILPDSPAWQKDIHQGDRIVAVAQDGGPAVPVDGSKLKQAVDLIRGPVGTSVYLTLVLPVDDGSPARVVRFTRATLKLPPSAHSLIH